MARRINFLFLALVLYGFFWLLSSKQSNSTILLPSQEGMQEHKQVIIEPRVEINPKEEVAKLNIQTPLYDDCDVARIFYGEGLKVEYCSNDGFYYRQKTTFGMEFESTTIMYDADMKELGGYSRRTDPNGIVNQSGLSLGGICRIVDGIREACANGK